MNGRGAGRQRRGNALDGGGGLPGDRQRRIRQPVERGALTDQRQHGLAAKAHEAGGQHRLILQLRENAEGILTRHVLVRQNGDEPRRGGDDGAKIAEREAGRVVR